MRTSCKTLKGYFPKELGAVRGRDAPHRLRREIIVTVLANDMVNLCGPTFAARRLMARRRRPSPSWWGFEAVREVLGFGEVWSRVAALDGKVEGEVQLALYAAVQNLLLDRVVWFLRNAEPTKGLAADHRALPRRHRSAGRVRARRALPTAGRGRALRARASSSGSGVPDALARRIAISPRSRPRPTSC